MKHIEIRLNLTVVAPLLDVVKFLADSLKNELALQRPEDEGDADMAELWRHSLLETQNSGIGALLALFDADFFKTGTISLAPHNAEPVIRACSAIRLKMRSQLMGQFSDEELEHGIDNLEKLADAPHRAMACYLFLATIQELIIEHLDTAILGDDK